MADIKIATSAGAVVNSIAPNPNAISKYVTAGEIDIQVLPDLENALSQPLVVARQNPISLGLQFSGKVDFGSTSNPELTFAASVKQSVNVNAKPGSNLIGPDMYGSPVVVNNGEGYLSLALNGTVNVGLSGSSGSDLKFGLNAGGGIGTEYFKRFPVTATQPTVGQALQEVLADFIVPADIDDLSGMSPGDISTVSGNGSFKLSGDVTISLSANPLASPSLPLVNQSISLQAGASLDVGASYRVSGEYQIRARKLADQVVELGYYQKKGTQWTVSAKASAGVGVTLGKTDLLANLISRLTGKPQADVATLIAGGLTSDQAKQIQDQITQSIDHSLKASLDAALSNSNANEAAFLYQIDIAALDRTASDAVHAALDGNLSQLTALERNASAQGVIARGVTLKRSVLRNVQDGKASLKVNLLGLLNFSSMFELIQRSEVLFEPITGDLTINETVSGTTIGVLTLPAAQDKLRRIKFNALLMTSAYRASQSAATMQSTSSDVFFAYNHNTNEHTMSDYLDGLIALDLLSTRQKQQLLAAFHGAGPSTYLLRAEFNDAASTALFVDPNTGITRDQSYYEQTGRNAMLDLLQPGDASDAEKYRRDVISNDATWNQLKKAGQPNFGTVLPELAQDEVRLNVVRSDYTAIMWWAHSMATTAPRVAAVRALVAATDPATLAGNNSFHSKVTDLRKHVAGVVGNSGLQFGLPFGLAALYQASASTAVANGLIVADGVTQTFAAVPRAKALGAGGGAGG